MFIPAFRGVNQAALPPAFSPLAPWAPSTPPWILVDPKTIPDAVAAMAYRAALNPGNNAGYANQVITYGGQQYLLRTRNVATYVVPANDPITGSGEKGFVGSPPVLTAGGLSPLGGGPMLASMTFVYVQAGSGAGSPSFT